MKNVDMRRRSPTVKQAAIKQNEPLPSCLCLCIKSRPLCENVFRPQVHFHANQTHFHMKGFAPGLVLKQRFKVTRNWPGGVWHKHAFFV